MGEYHILGGNKLFGETKIHGAKNAILPMLASVVLNNGISIIHNCPSILDTFVSIEILESIGCKVQYENNTITIDSSFANNYIIPEKLVREMRSSIIFLGGILGRFKQVKISYPGGCELGARPIDLHLENIKKLGVDIIEEHGYILCNSKKIVGEKINLDFPSVGATENLMLASVLSEGETIISNSAKEPEIIDLQNFLNSMGANIVGAGTDTIIIKGVDKLHDVEYTVMPDRIVAGTFLTAAAITKGEITLHDINPNDMTAVTSKLVETGCKMKQWSNEIYIKAPDRPKSIQLRTYPHPGLPKNYKGRSK